MFDHVIDPFDHVCFGQYLHNALKYNNGYDRALFN